MERVIRAREMGTNLFLNLDTGELLTPPASITGVLGKDDRSWESLDIPEDSRSFRYIQWLRESGADLMFAGDGKVIGFDGAFPFAHGNNSTNWESWDDLTPAQVQKDVAVIEWGRKVDAAKLRNLPWPEAPLAGGIVNSAAQLDSTSSGGPLVNLLTLKQSAMWFFKTRKGGMGILQITGFTENPRGVKLRYKLVLNANAKTVSASPALPTSAFQIRLVADASDNSDATDTVTNFLDANHGESLRLLPGVLLDGKAVERAGWHAAEGRTNFVLGLTEEGSRQFEALTATNLQHRLAILFQGRVLFAPNILAAIYSRTLDIPVNWNMKDLERTMNGLNQMNNPVVDLRFGPEQESILPPLKNNWTFLNLRANRLLTTSIFDFESRAFHDWQRDNGADVAAPASSAVPLIMAYGMATVPALANGLDNNVPADIWYNWNLMVNEPEARSYLGQNPKTGQDTYYFRTRDDTWGILQITGFTDNPRGVKIRYKLVQNGSATEINPDVSPALLAEPPKLQFLAWQGEWRTNHSGAARHPDGSPVTNAEELQWLKAVHPSGFGGTSESQARFLKLWFSDPAFKQTHFAEVSLLDDNGHPLKPGAHGLSDCSWEGAGKQNGWLGWLCWSGIPEDGTNLPAHLTIQLRYTIGPLEETQEIEPDFNGAMSLAGDSVLNGLGQTAQGQAFVAIAINASQLKSRVFDVVAVAKSGREILPHISDRSGSGGSGVGVAKFEFEIPLSEVEKFIIGTRSIRTNEWKNVVLPRN
jgi:hypothetical protein